MIAAPQLFECALIARKVRSSKGEPYEIQVHIIYKAYYSFHALVVE
jgi:hypothetical protein